MISEQMVVEPFLITLWPPPSRGIYSNILSAFGQAEYQGQMFQERDYFRGVFLSSLQQILAVIVDVPSAVLREMLSAH